MRSRSSNLLDNAIKYTRSGGLALKVGEFEARSPEGAERDPGNYPPASTSFLWATCRVTSSSGATAVARPEILPRQPAPF